VLLLHAALRNLRNPGDAFAWVLLWLVAWLGLPGREEMASAQRVGLPSNYGTTPETAPPDAWSSPPPTSSYSQPSTYGATNPYSSPAYAQNPYPAPTYIPSSPAPTYIPSSPAANPYATPSTGYPSASLGAVQPFDPYAIPPGSPMLPPLTGGPVPPPVPSFEQPPALPGQTWPAPGVTSPWLTQPPPPYGSAPYGYAYPYGPTTPYPTNPYAATNPYTNPYGPPAYPAYGPPYERLFQDTGFRNTFLAGGSGAELQMNEVEISTSAIFRNFLGGTTPLRVTPGFVFHFLDGPSPPVEQDLPAHLYSGYLDFGMSPQFNPAFSADLNFRTGIYSDFQTVTTDSMRFMGSAVGIIRCSPATALKLGGAYIDRQRYKFMPAAGLLWTPNPQLRWDIFFPSPKLATYWRTVGNRQLWWYMAGEYGGGSWTIDREEEPMQGASEKIDINDWRASIGLEWINLNRSYSFIEAGYVFDREIYYTLVPEDTLSLDNTIMVRGGISF